MAAGEILRFLKMPENAPESPETGLSECAEDLSEIIEKLSDGLYTASDGQERASGKKRIIDHRVPKMPDWEHKALSKATFYQKTDVVSVFLALSVGGIAVAASIVGMEAKIQIALYVMMIICIVLFNPLHAVERILALPSRVLLSIILFLMDICIGYPRKNVLIALVVLSIISIGVIITSNRGWLIEEMYLATEFTRKAQRLDIEDLPYISWRAHGKNELWTTLEQAGLTVTEHELNLGYRIAWRLGYYDGMTMVEAVNKSIKGLESKIEELEKEAKNNENWKNSYYEMDSQIDKLKIELKEAQDEAESFEVEIEDHIKRELRYEEQLKYLGKQVQEYKAKGTTYEAVEDLVKRMLEAGIVYRKIELVTGWNKLRIGEVRKKYGIELKGKQDE